MGDTMQSLYILRVKIKNFRNLKNVDVNLGHKEVIIGENNVGKTNFLRALQLILAPSLSDEDRMLDESDFNDMLVNPMENNEEILAEKKNYKLRINFFHILMIMEIRNMSLIFTRRMMSQEDSELMRESI